MNEEREKDLSHEEQEALRGLAYEPGDSFGDEDRVVEALARRGLIRRSRPPILRRSIQVAAAAAVLLVTFFLGARYGRNAVEDGAPMVQPAEERGASSEFLLTKAGVESSPVIEEYRDEPDQPGNGGVLFPKVILLQ